MIIRGKKGVTLIEVMVVVAIVGFLAAIAIPAYNDYVTRSRRSDAFTALETVRAAQEMYRAEQGFYAGDFFDGGVNVLAGCSSTMAGDNYSMDIDRSVGFTQYTVIATPGEKQTGDLFLGTDENGEQYDCTPGTCNHANLRTITNGWQQRSWEDLR